MSRLVISGIKGSPFDEVAIGRNDLDLFAGREKELSVARKGMGEGRGCLFIEGGSGVGKSSFGNYIRFEKANRGICVTPDIEVDIYGVRDEAYFLEAALLASFNALQKAAVSRGKKLNGHKEFKRLERGALGLKRWFQKHSADIICPASSASLLKTPLPSEKIRFLLDLCADIAVSIGYKEGLLVQGRVGEIRVISRQFIESLFFSPRFSWILTGPLGSGRKVAGKVAKMSWLELPPVESGLLRLILAKRLKKYAPKDWQKPPLSYAIPEYLHRATDGDLLYTFRICNSLLKLIFSQQLIDSLSLKHTSGLIKMLAAGEVKKLSPTPLALRALKRLALAKFMSTGGLAMALKKKQTSISRALSELKRAGLASYHSLGRQHLYTACSAAKVAYRKSP